MDINIQNLVGENTLKTTPVASSKRLGEVVQKLSINEGQPFAPLMEGISVGADGKTLLEREDIAQRSASSKHSLFAFKIQALFEALQSKDGLPLIIQQVREGIHQDIDYAYYLMGLLLNRRLIEDQQEGEPRCAWEALRIAYDKGYVPAGLALVKALIGGYCEESKRSKISIDQGKQVMWQLSTMNRLDFVEILLNVIKHTNSDGAKHTLALLYQFGYGSHTQVDLPKAVDLYLDLAARHPVAYLELAYIYEKGGFGFERDLTRSKMYWNLYLEQVPDALDKYAFGYNIIEDGGESALAGLESISCLDYRHLVKAHLKYYKEEPDYALTAFYLQKYQPQRPIDFALLKELQAYNLDLDHTYEGKRLISLKKLGRVVSKEYVLREKEFLDSIKDDVTKDSVSFLKLLEHFMQEGILLEENYEQTYTLGEVKVSAVILRKLLAECRLHIALEGFEQLRNIPRSELWRLFIDWEAQAFGPYIFEDDEGYLPTLMDAFAKNLSIERFNDQSYQDAHAQAVGNVALTSDKLEKKSNGKMGFFAEEPTNLRLQYRDPKITMYNTTHGFKLEKLTIEGEEALKHLQEEGIIKDLKKGKTTITIVLEVLRGSELSHFVNKVFASFYENTSQGNNLDQKLLALAQCVQTLDRAHAFYDGNSRLHATQLYHVLRQHLGLPPSLLEDPYHMPVVGADEFVIQMKAGEVRMKRILEGFYTSDTALCQGILG